MNTLQNYPARTPRWFRFALAGMMAVLLVPYFLLREGGESRASTPAALMNRMLGQVAPLLRAQRPTTLRVPQTASGSYFVNGMRVQYATYGAPRGGDEMLRRFESAFEKAGYLHRRAPVEGEEALVAIHPDTKVMLTARPERDARGRSVVRLSQQNLSELDPRFRAEIAGVPTVPGASGKLLVEQADRAGTSSLTYSASTSPQSAARFYLQQMKAFGWERLVSPAGSELAGSWVLFFQKDGVECSVVVMADPEAGASMVLVTRTTGGGLGA